MANDDPVEDYWREQRQKSFHDSTNSLNRHLDDQARQREQDARKALESSVLKQIESQRAISGGFYRDALREYHPGRRHDFMAASFYHKKQAEELEEMLDDM